MIPIALGRLPMLICIGVLTASLTGAYFLGRDHGQAAVTKRWQQANEVQRQKIAELQDEARQRQAETARRVAEIATAAAKEREKRETEVSGTIDDLRAGNVRLRDRLAAARCPSVPASTGDTSGAADPSTHGLSDADAEFLIRLAGECDDTASRLNALQHIVRE